MAVADKMSVQNETKKTKNFRSLSVTLAISFLLLSVLILAVSSSLLIYFTLEAQQQLIADQQQLIAQSAADKVKDFIQEKSSVLMAAASTGNMVAGNQQEKKINLEKTLGIEPSFRQLFLMDERGQEIMSVSRLSSSMSGLVYEYISKDDMVSRTSQEETYIGSVYIDMVTSEPMVTMAVPVKDVFGDFKGILAAEVNLKFMWDLVGRIEVGRNGVAYVVDKNGKLLAFGDISRVLGGDSLMYLHEVEEFVKGDEGHHVSSAETSVGIQGNQVVANHAHLYDPDWAVVVELPVEEAYEHVNLEIMLSISTIILSIVMAVLFAVYLSRRITGPIINLRDAAIEIGRGRLDTRIEVRTRNEISELANAFNQMAQYLKESRKKLEEYSRGLEKQVAERTKDLELKVNELTETKTAVLNMMEDMDTANKDLIKTREQLKESLKELKETDIKKDQFISIAAHELKTPLTSIHGFSQLLQDRKIADKFAERTKYLKIMEHETNRLAKLVGDILDLSRIDLHTIKMSTEEVDLNRLVGDVKSEMEIPIKDKKLQFEYKPQGRLPKIVTDPERVTQILINLINNSVKYTEKGKITLEVSSDTKNVHFTVKDTGIGIAKEYQEKIFERFYQIDSSYTRKAGGTGLGLALVKEFVSLLGGRIWVKSQEGKGSEFHFTMPIKGATKKQMSDAEKKVRREIKKSIKVSNMVQKMGFGAAKE